MRSSSLSFLWILFQVDCLFSLCLVSLVGLYPASSSATYSSVVSFCLTWCLWSSFHSLQGYTCSPGVCPWWLRLLQGCVNSRWERMGPALRWVGLSFVPLVGGPCFKGCVWGSLWAQHDPGQPVGGAACLSWPGIQHWDLQRVGWIQVLVPRWDLQESSCWLFPGTGSSLLFQGPGLSIPITGAQVRLLAGEPRPCKPYQTKMQPNQKKKKNGKENRQTKIKTIKTKQKSHKEDKKKKTNKKPKPKQTVKIKLAKTAKESKANKN